MKNQHNINTNKDKNQKERLDKNVIFHKETSVIKNKITTNGFPIPIDLIDDLKNDKLDVLTEGRTNLGYVEKPPRKKELDQKEHYDQDDK